MVVAPHQLAADAGRDMLLAGGSAVDAAVAAAFALCVVDPADCGVGGYGGFLSYSPGAGDAVSVEFNTWAPDSVDLAALRPPGAVGSMVRGGGGVAPPAVVPGLLAAQDRFGRLSREEVLAPSIALARGGFPVGPYLAWTLDEHRRRGGRLSGEFAALFFPDGRPLAAGTTFRQPELAATLEAVRDNGADALAVGAIAAAIAESVQRDGGTLTTDDLRGGRVAFGRPAQAACGGLTAYGPSPEGSGTEVLFHALAALDVDRLDRSRGPGYIAAVTDALRSAWSARRAHGGPPTESPHTAHLCAAGPDGDLVALTFTHGPWFGSALVAAGTGIVLNGGANVFAPSTAVGGAPRARAAANMAPLILIGAGGDRHAVGAAGGPRIPAMLLTALLDVVYFGLSLDEAITAPHLSVQADDGSIEAEAVLCAPLEPLEGAHVIRPGDFGPVYGISQTSSGYVAAVDQRFESGLAMG
jgi:gamma-glutamyltranspeptidase/glutathione hydrolase